MNIHLVSIERDGVVRLAAEGPITAGDFAGENGNPFTALIGERWSTNKVLLSLKEATYIDSSALGWIISCQKEFKVNGGLLVLYAIPPRIRQIFDLLRMGMLVPLASDEAEARKCVQEAYEAADSSDTGTPAPNHGANP